MKKTAAIITSIIILVSILSAQPLKAALFIDINGEYIDLGDEGSVYGSGISFLWDMPRYFDNDKLLFYINSTYAYSSEYKDEPSETVRTYVPLTAGFEYRYRILPIPLYVTGSAGAGASYFKREGPVYYGPFMDPSKTQIDTAFGPYADVMVGLNYILTQNLSVSAKGGYQLSRYNEDNIESPAGLRFTAGLRYALSGGIRSLGGVDDWYEDSEPVKSQFKTRPAGKVTYFEFTPGVIIPLGKFEEMAETGFGGMINLNRRNLFFKGFTTGIGTGLYYAPGKDNFDGNNKNYDRFIILPLLINTGYRFNTANRFYIIPSISYGASYLNFSYEYFVPSTLKMKDENKNTIDPTVKGGLRIEYKITGLCSLTMSGEYGSFIEKSGAMPFAIASLGVDYIF